MRLFRRKFDLAPYVNDNASHFTHCITKNYREMSLKLHPVHRAVLAAFACQPMLAGFAHAQDTSGAVAAQQSLPEVTVKADAGQDLGTGYNPSRTVSATKTE